MARMIAMARHCVASLCGLRLAACAFAVCLGLGPGGVRAADDAELLRTQALMELIGSGASVDQFVNLVYQQSVAALLQANPDKGDEVRSFVDDQVLPEIRAAVPTMMMATAGGLAQVFSEAELEEIVAFYQSPVGRKLRRARPALMRQTVKLGQFWAAQTFRAALTKLAPQLEAQGLKAPDV